MHTIFSLIPAFLAAGFLAGHGLELTADIVPLLFAITAGFLALSATNLLSERD